MHVLLISHFYPPEIGAPQRRWNAFVKEWRQQGIDVTVITPLPHYPDGKLGAASVRSMFRSTTGDHGERIVRVPFVPGARSSSLKLIDQAVSAVFSVPAAAFRPFDVVLTTSPGLPSLIVGHLLAKTHRVPHVVEMRDAWPDLISQAGLGPRRLSGLLERIVTRVQRAADHVVTVSEDFADVLRARLGNVRVSAVSNGIDPRAVPSLSPRRLGDRPIRALYLGTVGVSQALETVIEAAHLAGPEIVQLEIVGGGSRIAPLTQLAHRLGVDVTFRGQVAGSELWRTYERSDTIVVSLRDWSAFLYTVPSKLYEIFALGKHVSGSLAGEAARLIDAAGAGVCAPPEDAQMLADTWRRMCETGEFTGQVQGASRRWVSDNASYEILARRYIDILEQTLGGVRP